MGCFVIPSLAALAHHVARQQVPSWREDRGQESLNRLLLGGAVFGLVDHAYNGELFMFGEDIVSDLLLGVLITVSIVAVWAVLSIMDRTPRRASI